MNHLVKITRNDDGDRVDDPKWCLMVDDGGSDRALCTAEVFGEGESSAVYETRSRIRGGITCPDCLAIIEEIKSVKL